MHKATPPLKCECASAISQGGRDYQEDAIITDFSTGAEFGFAVLSDGMGGHAAGDVASKIVVTELFSELTFRRDELCADPTLIAPALREAALSANACLSDHVLANPHTRGMGATLLACVVMDNALFWISVGDSPLFLFRDNELRQLNQDHSMGPHIDFLVRSGAMSAEAGRYHPERNALTSVLLGQDIAQIDCPETPFALQPGDTILVASDGLQYLENEAICEFLRNRPDAHCTEISDGLMAAVQSLDDPDLDNVTFAVVQIAAQPEPETATPFADARSAVIERWPFQRRQPDVNIPAHKADPHALGVNAVTK